MQIGPRIRVGGTLGKIGQKAKIGVGKLAQPVGKVVSVFNPALGTAISTAGDILDTSDGKFNFGNAAKNAAIQYVGGKIVGKVAPKIGGLFNKGAGAAGDIGLPGGDIASAAEPSRFRSLVSGAGKFLGGKDGFGVDDVLSLSKGLGDAYGAYDTGKTVDAHRRLVSDEYNANAPLRDAARQMLLAEAQPMEPLNLRAEPPRYRRVNVGGRMG